MSWLGSSPWHSTVSTGVRSSVWTGTVETAPVVVFEPVELVTGDTAGSTSLDAGLTGALVPGFTSDKPELTLVPVPSPEGLGCTGLPVGET